MAKILWSCVAVHCHFGLRGDEADRDMAHAESVARSLGARFRSVRFDTRSYMREHGANFMILFLDSAFHSATHGKDIVVIAHRLLAGFTATLHLILWRCCRCFALWVLPAWPCIVISACVATRRTAIWGNSR